VEDLQLYHQDRRGAVSLRHSASILNGSAQPKIATYI